MSGGNFFRQNYICPCFSGVHSIERKCASGKRLVEKDLRLNARNERAFKVKAFFCCLTLETSKPPSNKMRRIPLTKESKEFLRLL